jgi:hypothetical protein
MLCPRAKVLFENYADAAREQMADPFSKGALIRVKIHTQTDFFQTDATVMHSTNGLGMGVMFHPVNPPFLLVLQRWLSEAQQEVRQCT